MRRSPVAHEEEERALRSLSRRANRIINVGTALTVSAAGLSTIYFLGLQYLTNNKIDLLPDSNILWKVTVVAYFSSWVLGVRFDKDNEEDAYVSAPNRGKIPAIDAALVLLVAVIFSFIAVLEEISSNADQSGNPIAELALRVFGGWAASISKLYIKYGALSFLTILNTIWFLNIFLWRYFLKRYVYDMSLRSSCHYDRASPTCRADQAGSDGQLPQRRLAGVAVRDGSSLSRGPECVFRFCPGAWFAHGHLSSSPAVWFRAGGGGMGLVRAFQSEIYIEINRERFQPLPINAQTMRLC